MKVINMNKFLINLDRDTEKMSYHRDVIRITATDGLKLSVDEIKNSKLYMRYNTKEKKIRGHLGCILSHVKLLQHIVDNKINDVCILEDDSTSDFELPDELKDTDHITYLGGWLVNKKMKDIKKPVEQELKDGINKLIDARVLTTRAYYIPEWKHAQGLLDHINNKKVWRGIDIMVSEYVRHLYYPALSHQILGFESSIGNMKPKHNYKFYIPE